MENFKQWFIYVMDCWLSTFYKNIWRHRNDVTITTEVKKKIREHKIKQKAAKTKAKAKKHKLQLCYDPSDIQEIRNKKVSKVGNKEITEYLVKYWTKDQPIWMKSNTLTKHAEMIKEYEYKIQELEDENITITKQSETITIQEMSPEVKPRRMTNILGKISSPRVKRQRTERTQTPKKEEETCKETEDNNKKNINTNPNREKRDTRRANKRRHDYETEEEEEIEYKLRRRKKKT